METYHGQIRTPQDAIILFEACRMGMLPRVQRRLSEKERQSIRSGSVFVWDEREAGMRRWTDGKSWSASRVSGSFLTYREMEGKRGSSTAAPPMKTPEHRRNSGEDPADGDEGPDGYRYKPDGLMKQSFSITTSTNQHLHLISYFSRAHPTAPGLPQPSTDPTFRIVRPAKGLYPESAVHDQGSVAAVTRSPLAATPPYSMPSASAAAYPRPVSGHPHAYAYGAPSHPISVQSMSISTDGHPPRPYANGHGGPPLAVPQYSPSPHPSIAAAQAPPNSLDQRPRSKSGDPNSNLLAQPQPQQRQQQQQRPSPREHSPMLPPNPALSIPPENRSPSSAAPIDPRLTSNASSAARPGPPPPINGQSPLSSYPSPPERRGDEQEMAAHDQHGLSRAAGQPSTNDVPPRRARAEVSSVNSIMTTAPPENRADRPASRSPGGTTSNVDGPADIPSQKLAFGEDQRALKALDKVFI